ncbi:hypothetical protein WR25_00054 [Diploscapter pachys]|uniref:Transcription factor IIIC subunit 5 HTH domain-containing protein n=1 Tax=Diploscapter pachys TaxID=2018661 RepID=A0A2A2KE55_9BILA|nr:hypothetical protein WR25_00054 [Diploscapter pachys]
MFDAEDYPGIVIVQYPGIVRNVDKALQTLGGVEKMSQAHRTKVTMELKHTPENPYTSRCFSNVIDAMKVTSGTVRMAIKVRRKKNDKSCVKIDCIGLVTHVYRFDDMCDFQYLPLKKKPGCDHHEDLLPKLIPSDLPTAFTWWERTECDPIPLYLPPYQFSRYNIPSNKLLARDTDYVCNGKGAAGKNMRKTRTALSVTVQARDEFPPVATDAAIADAEFRCKAEEPHNMLKKLFDERPMWTRTGLTFCTGLDDHVLKILLPKFAFYILSGPWGRLWCRFGYDPRLHEEAKKYQTVMVSFRQNNMIPEKGRLKVALVEKIINDVNVDYRYERGRIPQVRQMWYCVCDIGFPEVADIIARDFSSAAEPGMKAVFGWIPVQIIDEIRDLIKQDVKKKVSEVEFMRNIEGNLTIEDI